MASQRLISRCYHDRVPRSRDPALTRRGEKAFALLLVVTLLAFLVILLVGLATYTRVETAVAGNTQRQAQARENALLALNVAVAHLQKYTGADKRVTATADAFPNDLGTRHYTGVWPTDPVDYPDGDPLKPLTWLVSGNELADDAGVLAPRAVTPEIAPAAATSVVLVGANTSRTANDVRVPLVPLTVNGVPGVAQASSPTIGRYAWWIGDQGVKAPVAISDRTSNVTYAPWDTNDARLRLRQQIALGAGAADAAGNAVFEPRDGNNSPLVANEKITSAAQIAFLKNAANAQLGLRPVQDNFHAWSPNNFNVLANSKLGGLRQDLSLRPDLLGAGFDAWRNYDPLTSGYMEDPLVPITPVPVPPYDPVAPLRRRYRITPPIEAGGVVHGVAPVLGFFGLSFSIRESSTSAPEMEVASRCVVSLWNPYSSALVPESLKVEVTGLPLVSVEDSVGGNHPFDLQSIMSGGGAMVLALDWTPSTTEPDRASWLPGRTYTWAAPENLTPLAAGIPMVFHYPDATPIDPAGKFTAGQGIVRQVNMHHHVNPPFVTTPITRTCESSGPTRLRVRLLRASDDAELARYDIDSPKFGPTSPIDIAGRSIDFVFVARLPEHDELPTGTTERWLSASGRDPRAIAFPATGFISGAKGDDPGSYGGLGVFTFEVRDAERLLDRGGGRYSADEDVPVFELPRSPLLSLGMLQHLQLAGARPFSVGNSWGSAVQINAIPAAELFDRFFFSGVAPGTTPVAVNGALLLPNPLLKVLRDSTTAAAIDLTQLQAAPDGQSSKFLLHGGTFNLNSISPTAWAAVLRSVRFPAPQAFSFLEPGLVSGSTADTAPGTVQSGDAQFFRFPQSAHETYRANETYVQNTVSGTDQFADTYLFRRGMRTLTAAQVAALAANISTLVAERQTQTGRYATSALFGPFRSVEEFVQAPLDSAGSPLLVDAGGVPQSLIERAIADTDINAAIRQFSSQWLTQGDIFTTLAPVLFPRSDTFVVRTYGEAVNPATNATEGRAWCEALVQRVPEYFDPNVATGDAAETAPTALVSPFNQTYGRRFKIISFRWLTRSDI